MNENNTIQTQPKKTETKFTISQKKNVILSNDDIEIISGNAKITSIGKAFSYWEGQIIPGNDFIFQKAYKLEPLQFGDEISSLGFRVHGREFKNLSFLSGETLQEFMDHYTLRKHPDGTKYLFQHVEIPTFDFEDRVWDGDSYMAVYKNEIGYNMLYCRCGYSIPSIMVYIGLIESESFFTDLMKKLE